MYICICGMCTCVHVYTLSCIFYLLLYTMFQISKALELYEQLRQRMGVVIVGPSGSGKSSLWSILKLALNKIGRVVKTHTMNPKAMPRTQVQYG